MKIVSGGQTGADRGAVDAAVFAETDWGGWIPRDRRAEDGAIHPAYHRFKEHPSGGYPPRTRTNVLNSDATAIFARLPLSGGSALTARCCRELDKPFVVLNPDEGEEVLLGQLVGWLGGNGKISVLNVAGHRESRCPGLQKKVCRVVSGLLSRAES